LVACVGGLFITAQLGGSAMDWHFRLGYAVLALLGFRVVWGFVGGYWSRFQNFVFTPAQVLAYIKGMLPSAKTIGHNPLGMLSVFGLLGLVALQALSGLCSDDEIASAGPLTAHIPSRWVSFATFYHKEINKVMLIALVVLHVLAIVYYKRVKHHDLIKPMLLGDKVVEEDVPPSKDAWGNRLLALAVLAAVGGALAWGLSVL
jgi:cytochrome b